MPTVGSRLPFEDGDVTDIQAWKFPPHAIIPIYIISSLTSVTVQNS